MRQPLMFWDLLLITLKLQAVFQLLVAVGRKAFLTLSTLGEVFCRRHIEIFFYFPKK